MSALQTSIANPISCYGIGIHSGQKTQLTLKPAQENTGVVFIRKDLPFKNNVIFANYNNVFNTHLATNVKNEHNVEASTIEHLMAAIWGCGIDNLIVELDGQEVPIMDGSSKPFVFMIECAGIKQQKARRKYLKIIKEVSISYNDCELIAIPAEMQSIDLTIDFNSNAIGKQSFIFSPSSSFINDIASARTFGFLEDINYLKSKGLAKGASLDNAIGIDKDIILNHDGLRYKDEFVRHKLLDLMGDFYCSGSPIIAHIIGYKTSHQLNNQFLRKIFSDKSSYQWI